MGNKYFIITIGCQMNISDSERFANYLEKLGYREGSDENSSNLVVLTTCGVRQSAEDRIYGLIPKIKKNNPSAKIVLTGCLSERADVKKRLSKQVDIFLNIKDLPSLATKLGKLGRDESKRIEPCDYLRERPKYKSNYSAYLPIGNGCDNFCSYCVVPYARGRESYRSAKEIIEECKSLVNKDYKEITLIAQNVNSYKDESLELDFADLLKAVNDIEGDFWLRFSTSHPKDVSEKLINTMQACDKLCHHLHLPAQSGDDDILTAMNRRYKSSDYLRLIDKIREAIPDISFTTDIIVGFPGERREHFENTKKLFELVKFDMAYISQYSPRPETQSAKMDDDVSRDEKKRREAELMEVLRRNSLENNKQYLNKEYEVLIEAFNKKRYWVGKNKYSKTIRATGFESLDLVGEIVKVKITEIQDLGLSGEIVNKKPSAND